MDSTPTSPKDIETAIPTNAESLTGVHLAEATRCSAERLTQQEFPENGFTRVWVESENIAAASGSSVRIVSLNILAESLARGSAGSRVDPRPCPPLFEKTGVCGVAVESAELDPKQNFIFSCKSEDLCWKRRWPKLKEMILSQEPDVIGLQELDLCCDQSVVPQAGKRTVLVGNGITIQEELDQAGYNGIVARKKGHASDGVGLFWRKSRFQATGNPMCWPLSGTVHVALAQRLHLLSERANNDTFDEVTFTAVVTHLKAGLNSDAENLRAKQACALLKCIRQHPNVILMADMNAHPRPFVPQVKADGRPSADVDPMAYEVLSKSLRSAYAEALGEENAFTCWGGMVDKEARGAFDYIFVRGGIFSTSRILGLPPAEEVLQFPDRLPNASYPTDHFMLVADIKVATSPSELVQASGQEVLAVASDEPPEKRPRICN